ncbi:MAG: pilus assembly PilX N-terminal domain-containing protein [Patescibacteria group bacterium]
MFSSKSYHLKPRSYQSGQAVITSVIFLVLLSVIIIAGFSTPLARQLKSVRAVTNSHQAYFAAEGGVEDAIYRLKNSLNYNNNYTLTIDSATAEVTIASSGNTRTVIASGNASGHYRTVSMEMDLSEVGAELAYGIQVGDGGLIIGNADVNGNVYSNGNIIGSNGATIIGDVIVAGGLNTDPSVEWTIQNADQAFANSSGNIDIGQSFTATAAGALNKVSVYLGKVGTPNNNLTLRIMSNLIPSSPPFYHRPSNTTLASEIILPTSVGLSPSWIDVSFTSAPTLVSGTKYWIVLDYNSNSAVNYWNWRKDAITDYSINANTGRYTGSCCGGSPTWTDITDDLAFKVWIGGTNNKIDNVTIGDASTGTAYANLFTSTTVHGSACPNAYCVVSNPAREELPISDGVIQDWRDTATLGGVNNGNLTINTTSSFGPKEVSGNLTVELGNSEVLTVVGTIYVTGDLTFNCGNGSQVVLDPAYEANSGVIVADGKITVSNHCAFSGSGDSDSYLMLLSAKNDSDSDNEAIEVDNNSTGVIYYAGHGWIDFNNNAAAREITAYGLDMANNSTVTYESGLGSLIFSSGPGGAFEITNWEEIE